MYLPTPAANAVAPRLYLTRESDFGAERKSVWDGFDITVNARLRGGLTTQIGTTTGRALVDTCAIATSTTTSTADTGAIDGPDPRGCHNVEPWQTTVRGLASYTIPKIDVLVSATVRSQPEMQLGTRNGVTGNTSAQWQVPNSVIIAASRQAAAGRTAHRQHDDSARPTTSTASTRTNAGRRWTCASRRSCASAARGPTSAST